MTFKTSFSVDREHRATDFADTRQAILRGACGLVIVGCTLFTALTFAGCRTTEGLGRDVEALGDNVADSAEENKP